MPETVMILLFLGLFVLIGLKRGKNEYGEATGQRVMTTVYQGLTYLFKQSTGKVRQTKKRSSSSESAFEVPGAGRILPESSAVVSKLDQSDQEARAVVIAAMNRQIREVQESGTTQTLPPVSAQEAKQNQKMWLEEAKSAGVSKEVREQWFTSGSPIQTEADIRRFLHRSSSRLPAKRVDLAAYRANNRKLMKKIEDLLEGVEPKRTLSFDTNIMMKCSPLAKKVAKHYPVILSKKVYEELDDKKTHFAYGSFARKGLKVIEDAQVTHNNFQLAYCDRSFLEEKGLHPASPDEIIIGSLLKRKEEGENILFITEDRGARILARDAGIDCLLF